MTGPHESLTIRIVRKFLESNLSMVFIIVSLAAGAIALVITPREEEPQIIVAAANVMVSFPGRTAQDVERLVSTPLEKMMIQIPGVEYVYSRSMPGRSIVTTRFYPGQPLEPSYVKLIRKLNENMDRVAPGVAGWVVKPIDVDDVPIVTFTLTSGSRDDYELRRMAEEIADRLQGVDNAGVAYVVGGRPRELLIRPSAVRMASYRISALDLSRAIQGSNASVLAGSFDRNDRDVRVQAGQFIAGARDLQELVVGAWNGRPVYLRDVAEVSDGPGEFQDYVRFHRGLAWEHPKEEGAAGSLIAPGSTVAPPKYGSQPAVTIAVAKKHGTNNVWVAEDLLKRAEELKKEILPADVQMVVTRNYGVTANDKVKELEEGLLVAIGVVMALLAIGLGYRQALVVAIVVPCVFGLTLIVNYLPGIFSQPHHPVRLDGGSRPSGGRSHRGCREHPPAFQDAGESNRGYRSRGRQRSPSAAHCRHVRGDSLVPSAALCDRNDGPVPAPHGRQRSRDHGHVLGGLLHDHAVAGVQNAERTCRRLGRGRGALGVLFGPPAFLQSDSPAADPTAGGWAGCFCSW